MRTTPSAVLVACLAFASAAPTQDAPAAGAGKHVNKVSDAAKAAFEKMEKASYNPVAVGLKELTGTVELKMDLPEGAGRPGMGGMAGLNLAFSVGFKAPSDLKVELKGEAQGPGRMMGDGMKHAVLSLMRVALGLMKPAEGDEYDADVVVEGGRTVLTIVRYENGVETDRSAMTLDDRGLIETMKSSSKPKPGAPTPSPGMPGGGMRGGRGGPPGGDEPTAVRFSWKKEGDRWLLEKMTSEMPGRTTDIAPEYTDAGGYRILTSWKMSGEGLRGGMSFGFRFTDLSVDGKKVDFPVEPRKGDAPSTPGGGQGGSGGSGDGKAK